MINFLCQSIYHLLLIISGAHLNTLFNLNDLIVECYLCCCWASWRFLVSFVLLTMHLGLIKLKNFRRKNILGKKKWKSPVTTWKYNNISFCPFKVVVFYETYAKLQSIKHFYSLVRKWFHQNKMRDFYFYL